MHLASFYTPFSDEIGEFSQDRECIGTKWELSQKRYHNVKSRIHTGNFPAVIPSKKRTLNLNRLLQSGGHGFEFLHRSICREIGNL